MTVRLGFIADDLPAPSNWRRSEIRIVERHYPDGGSGAVHVLLPNRTPASIRMLASRRGIRRAL